MKKSTLTAGLILAVTSMLATACGGGGGGGVSVPQHQNTKLVTKITTSGTLPNGTLIGAIDMTIEVPGGVTVKATPDSVNTSVLVTDPGVVVPSGVAVNNSLSIATYVPPQGNTPGKIRILVENANGFTTGEFVTVTLDLTRSGFPNTSDPVVLNFTVMDLAIQDISTLLSPGYTAALQ